MPVAAWYPEAVRLLKENPGLDAGLHLVITSEWENVKWRPLTHCPSLTDENGYFYPMMGPNPAYPGQSVMENKWDIKEVEQEFRAQIEMALRNIPQLSHITGHMLSTGFTKEVNELVLRLAKEYNLPSIDRMDSPQDYQFTYIGYDGPSRTSAEKEESFIRSLNKLEAGKRYLFLDHPALDNEEMKTVFHIGYEQVALDRQGVTDLLTSPRVKQVIEEKGIKLISINQLTKGLPRNTPSKKLEKAMEKYLEAVKNAGQDLHSIMIVQHGNVLAEKWMSEGKEDEPHVLNSVSKTFTASAIGFAIAEGKLKLTDKVISFFPDQLPANISENLEAMTIRDLLTMTCGHDGDLRSNERAAKNADKGWVEQFLAYPVDHKPGTFFAYNSPGTYMLSAIVQKVTGEKLVDYLYPRLFRPLGIVNVKCKKVRRESIAAVGACTSKLRTLPRWANSSCKKENGMDSRYYRRNGLPRHLPNKLLLSRQEWIPKQPRNQRLVRRRRLDAGLWLSNVALPPQCLPRRWSRRTIHSRNPRKRCRYCRNSTYRRYAG